MEEHLQLLHSSNRGEVNNGLRVLLPGSQHRLPVPLCWFAGGILYLLGTLMVTVAFNVPRNDTLARIDASTSEVVASWRDCVSGWTRWNHVRTIAALTAAVLFTAALNQL